MLYAAFHELIYGAGRKGQRDAMPECIKLTCARGIPKGGEAKATCVIYVQL